ncbi:hypothetical protein PHET_06231 [Paragonimus heterotremus]|uniref:Uncharacterized protein n=1 Tax=Paragonimus heterotremus TaxID=100268 RepID=A0A8J4TG55_9TREM|nr:hypothetical protein PHET_06231 [Paragonimus heterotremus]
MARLADRLGTAFQTHQSNFKFESSLQLLLDNCKSLLHKSVQRIENFVRDFSKNYPSLTKLNGGIRLLEENLNDVHFYHYL